MGQRDMNDKFAEGREGEKVIRKIFRDSKIEYFQADLLFKVGDVWNLAEIKYQEKFKPPPFYGHGLPPYQIDQRIKFFHEIGITPYLFIVDKNDEIIYWQSMIKLMEGKYFDTSGNKPRRIFPIENFMQWY